MPRVLPGELVVGEQYVRCGTTQPTYVKPPMTFTGLNPSGWPIFQGIHVNSDYEHFYKAGDPDIPQIVPAAAAVAGRRRKNHRTRRQNRNRKNSRTRRNNNQNQHGI